MYHIISIERECGSSGNDIGKILAKELGYQFLDHNVLTQAAKKLGLPATYIRDLEETSPGSIIFNLMKYSANKETPLTEQLFEMEKSIILEAAQISPCVVIGRCGGEIFGQDIKVLKIFIHADKEIRIQKTVEEKSESRSEAEEEVKRVDKRRKDFYNYHTNKVWGAQENFDLVIDSGKFGVEKCVKLIQVLNE